MSRVYIDNAILTAIANAIRNKLDTESTYLPKDMANAILNIEGNGYDTSVEADDPVNTGSKALIKETTLTAIANAIRTKTGVTDNFKPRAMAKAILSIANMETLSLYSASLLDSDWKFNLMGTTSSDTYASTTYAASGYDDSSWSDVSVPHDWSIYTDFNSSSTATYEAAWLDGGDGWYRRTLPITSDMAGKKFFIHFDGVYQISKIYVNGTLVGENYFGYNPFTVDITDAVNTNGTNTLAVFVRNQTPSSRWYSGSGIFRNVYFLVGEVSDFGMSDIVLTTPNLKTEVAAGGNVTLHVAANLSSSEAANLNYDIIIKDKNGNQFFTQKDTVSLSSGTTTLSKDYTIPMPDLWGEFQGNYYTVEFRLYTTGDKYYTAPIKYGFRYIEWDKDGFYLNGSRVFLKGMCMHHDLGILGAEVNRSAIDRQLKILMEMGCNSIRLTHNPSSTEYLDACVENGIILIEEFFDTWTSTKETYDFHNYFTDKMPEVIQTTLARDINNPAIVMWSLGNEIVRTSSYTTTTGPEIVQSIIDEIHKYDTTRPTTMGDDTPTNSVSWAIMECLDIIGVNYGDDSEYASVRTQFPNKCIYGSETTSALSSRGKYARDETNLYCSSLDNDYVSWGDAAATALKRHMETYSYLAGIYVWTGFDYLGEPTPFNKWPAKSSYFGCIDLAGFPKDSYYLYQSLWSDEPMIHMFPYWSGSTGSNKTMYVYSNCDHIELFLNGTSVGSKSQSDRSSTMYYYTYSIPFAKGTLVANGYDSDNNLIAQDVLYTAQSAQSLSLRSDKTQVAKDGSLVFVECDVLDNNGVILPAAANSVTFSCTGGTIVGVDNGNSADTTNMRSATKNAFSGKLLAMVRPDTESSALTITANSDGLLSHTISVLIGDSNIFTEYTQTFIDATNPPIYDYSSTTSTYTYESVDVSGVSSTGSKFTVDTRTVNLGEKTYYFEIDVSNNQSTALQNILSVGTAISSWNAASTGFNVHIYYPQSTSIVSPMIWIITSGSGHGGYLPTAPDTTIYRIAMNSNGLYVNGSLIFDSDTNNDSLTMSGNYSSVRSSVFSNMATSLSVSAGSQEGSNRNYSTWNAFKIYDTALTGDEMAEITALDYEEGEGSGSSEVTYNLNYTLSSEQTFSGSSTGTTLSDVKLLANTSQAWSLLISFQGAITDHETESYVLQCGSFSLNTASSRYNISYAGQTVQSTISTNSSDLQQLFIVHNEDTNAITIYNLTNGTVSTASSSSSSSSSSSGLVLGKSWTGTIYTLQTWDSSISMNEALATLPTPTAVTLKRTEVDVPFNTTVNVGIASTTPALALGVVVETAIINTVGTYSTATFEQGLIKITGGEAEGTDNINLELIDGTVLATVVANVSANATYEDERILYSLPEETVLTASAQSPIDTYVALLDEDKSFTFYIDFTPSSTNTAQADTYCVFHNMHEANPWPGLSYQIDGSNYAFHWFTASYDHTGATSTTSCKIAITHEIGTETLLIYIDGSLVTTLSATPTYGLTETLSIGAYKDSTGNYGRYWNGTVRAATIYNTALTATEIAAL